MWFCALNDWKTPTHCTLGSASNKISEYIFAKLDLFWFVAMKRGWYNADSIPEKTLVYAVQTNGANSVKFSCRVSAQHGISSAWQSWGRCAAAHPSSLEGTLVRSDKPMIREYCLLQFRLPIVCKPKNNAISRTQDHDLYQDIGPKIQTQWVETMTS